MTKCGSVNCINIISVWLWKNGKKIRFTGGIFRKNESKTGFIYLPDPSPGQTIQTKYRTLQQKEKYSLLEVDLLTGRTHQIRAHMASIGHPLVGDGKYGKNTQNRESRYKWQALCSYKLVFDFQTDAGILNYLNHREFTVPQVWFVV